MTQRTGARSKDSVITAPPGGHGASASEACSSRGPAAACTAPSTPPRSPTQVVTIFSAQDYASVVEVVYEWNDVFDIDVHPAISAEQGLPVGAEVFGRLPRLKQ